MFYVYIHLRLDTGEIFYVGKGQGKRAFSRRNRNQHWLNIVNLHGRSVHILSFHELESQAFEEESKLISQLMTGQLVNQTHGGEGCSGRKLTDLEKLRVSQVHSGKKLSQEHKERLLNSIRGKPSHWRKFNQEQAQEIRDSPGTLEQIAKRFGCKKTLIGKIRNNKATGY